jgi:hypothetical protein
MSDKYRPERKTWKQLDRVEKFLTGSIFVVIYGVGLLIGLALIALITYLVRLAF